MRNLDALEVAHAAGQQPVEAVRGPVRARYYGREGALAMAAWLRAHGVQESSDLCCLATKDR